MEQKKQDPEAEARQAADDKKFRDRDRNIPAILHEWFEEIEERLAALEARRPAQKDKQ